MVGQYHGPEGTAALAVVAPVWNIIYSLGLLVGIGGSVIFSTKRGSAEHRGSENSIFYSRRDRRGGAGHSGLDGRRSIFERPVLTFFGADAALLSLAQAYLRPIKYVFPLFLFNQMLAAFLRNDKAPGLATLGVLSGGIFNIFGDYFFVFPCDMGIYGAGLATAIGAGISFLVMLTHFFSRKNTLRLVKPAALLRKLREISVTGFSTFFIDVAMGILTVLFNRQIMRYLGANALAIYSNVQVSTFVQCCAYSVGQATQPIVSTNFGAKQGARIQEAVPPGPVDDGVFRRVLDGAQHGVPQLLYAHLYAPHAGNSASGPQHRADLCPLLPAAARQYFLDLLFPGDLKAPGGVHRLRVPGAGDQRRADPGASHAGRGGQPVVCHARD